MALLGILGSGESGMGAALLARRKGYEVLLSDSGMIPHARQEALRSIGAHIEEGGHTLERLQGAELIVKSPGIPETASIVVALRAAGVPVVSEIEFAGRYTTAKKICITGSNGKTTTTSLVYHILRKAGWNVGIGGNVGTSFARQVAEEQYDYYVLELSSFQLDGMYDFRADIGVLLNITPDHLDRYDYQLENYAASKLRIAQNMRSSESLVVCADDPVTSDSMAGVALSAQLCRFGLRDSDTPRMAVVREGRIYFSVAQCPDWSIALDQLSLRGKHNQYNCMAAGIVASLLGVEVNAIREGLADFPGIPHRLELVRELEGVRYVNDSKATNVDAVWYALESMPRGVVWIAGGTDKGNDYTVLQDFARAKVHTLICLGMDNRKLHVAFGGIVDTILEASSAKEAVHLAHRAAQDGDTVLLSPACASFDLFKNYEDRGNQFRKEVELL